MAPKDVFAADAIYVNGTIVTVDSDDSIVEAMAVKNGKILAVGGASAMRELASAATEVVDLAGKTVLPGINDSHTHAAMYGSSQPPLTLDLRYPAVRSIADIREAVRRRAGELQPGEWIRGNGWDTGYLEECLAERSRALSKADLDDVAPHNPVLLIDFSQHRLVANSKALELAGITRDSTTEPGSEIVKDPATGEPTGMLVELPAQGVLMRVVPLWTRAEKRAAIESMMRRMNARGITSVTEGALGAGGIAFQGGTLGSECISVYNDLHNDGALTLRLNILYLFGSYGAISLDDFKESVPTVGIHSGFGDEWLRLGGIKLFADGIPQTKTAWMGEDYPDGGNGSLVMPGATADERRQALSDMVAFAHKNRFQCAIHAVGDRAITACIDAIVRAQDDERLPLRHYLVHCDLISDADIGRAVAYDIGVTTQPALKWTFSDDIDTVLGLERSERQYPLRSLLDAGVSVSLSSDAPVTEPDWLQGVEAAVLRKSKASGTVRGTRQCITVREAIRAYTMGGARQDHMETRKGSLEPGKLADFCVLDQDILAMPPEDIHAIANVGTVVGGRIVYDAGLRR
jgi:predicted amidohydrolase YtcJ